ncbi:MAG: hypothetical protein ACOCXI_02270 [Chloroflexota bacterium]
MIKQEMFQGQFEDGVLGRLSGYSLQFPRHAVIAIILVIALFAFEIFNFDTTRYALDNLLGPVAFAGVRWASILALAFCAIDFAGLVRLFSPENDGEQPREVWFLMGAWLLGATMNALMTWWAVSLTLISHDFGNEVLSRGQLLQLVPVFVAVLVWLTRILFIGALTVAGSHLLEFGFSDRNSGHSRRLSLPSGQPLRERPANLTAGARTAGIRSAGVSETFAGVDVVPTSDEVPDFLARNRRYEAEDDGMSARKGIRRVEEREEETRTVDARPEPRTRSKNSRVRQRPPIPGARRSADTLNGHGRRTA